jgi:hypothetical protein
MGPGMNNAVSSGALKEILMQKIYGVLMTLAMSCFLLSPTFAEDSPPPGIDSRPCFSPNGCTQSSPVQMDKAPAQTAGQQASGMIPNESISHPLPMTNHEKFRYYLKTTYGPQSIGYSLANAGINKARNTVPEWGDGAECYGRQLASSFGQKAIERSFNLGLKTMFHEDLRYIHAGKSGVWNRSFYAASQVLIAHKDSGGTRPNYTWLAGTFGGEYVSRQWRPERYHNWSDYMSSFAVSLSLDAAKNLFNEFWPDVKRKIHF